MASTMSPAQLQALSQEVITTLTNVLSSRYLAVAGFVVMSYDHLLTLGDEVDLIWRNPKKPVSSLFLFNRYVVPVVVTIDLHGMGGLARGTPKVFCVSWFWIEGSFQTLCFAITHILVALRVRALYIKKPLVEWILLIGGILYFSTTVALAFMPANLAIGVSMTYSPIINACYPSVVPSLTYWIWVPALLFETLLFTLTVLRAVDHNRRHAMMPIAQLLYRDGFLYFIVISCCSIFNIVVWAALPVSLVGLAKYFTFSFINTMSSRLILNLRSLRRELDWGMPSGSGVIELQEYPLSPTTFRQGPTRPSHMPSVVRKASAGAVNTDLEVATHQSWGVQSGLGFYPVRRGQQLEVHMDVDIDVEVDLAGSGHRSTKSRD